MEPGAGADLGRTAARRTPRWTNRLPHAGGLEWFGSGARAFGLEPGQALTPQDYDTAKALMAGRDPHTGAAPVQAVLSVDPRVKIVAAPLAGALERAARRGVSAAELVDTKELRERVRLPLRRGHL